MSPKEVKRENKKLAYEKPVLIGLGDTLNLGMGGPKCQNGSHATNTCITGSYATSNCTIGFTPTGTCVTGGGK